MVCNALMAQAMIFTREPRLFCQFFGFVPSWVRLKGVSLIVIPIMLASCGDSSVEDSLAEMRQAIAELAKKGGDSVGGDVEAKVDALAKKIEALEGALQKTQPEVSRPDAKLADALSKYAKEIQTQSGQPALTVAPSEAMALLSSERSPTDISAVLVHLRKTESGDWQVITPKAFVLAALRPQKSPDPVPAQVPVAPVQQAESAAKPQTQSPVAASHWEVQPDGSKKLVFGQPTAKSGQTSQAGAGKGEEGTASSVPSGGGKEDAPLAVPESIGSAAGGKPDLRDLTTGQWQTRNGRRVFIPSKPQAR